MESRTTLLLMCLTLSGLVYQVISIGKFIRCCDANKGPEQQLGCVGDNFHVANCLGKNVELTCEKVDFLGNQAKCPNDTRQYAFPDKSRCEGTKTPRCVDISGPNTIKDLPVVQEPIGKFIRCCDANQGTKRQIGCVGDNFHVANCQGKNVELTCLGVDFVGNQAKCPNDTRKFAFPDKSRCEGTKTPRCVDISGPNTIQDLPVVQEPIGKFIRCCDANQGTKRQLGCEGENFTKATCGGKEVELTCMGVDYIGNQARCPDDNRKFPFPEKHQCKDKKTPRCVDISGSGNTTKTPDPTT
ncbi:uncharacterized protein MELLADRAFT_67679 [Melampsora larici-populina 98AG31]|uniref:Secreted protein n=1 Tax=Melampsora larici-populina (strain 98AG31 / pathotype 3-4-7) TaxID=747676 RepID=F4S417_MELLP|nr:uncharacterized protein MELLADRAFT_67679 [Melampsora larici-populina 98AG31]EGG00641.1 secreted protein [Melampsora larici-populina 98AG31]